MVRKSILLCCALWSIFSTTTADAGLSFFEYAVYNSRACKKSLDTTAKALLSDTFHKHCLMAARKRLYRPKSKIGKQFQAFPKELQKIFLELLNRRIDGDKSYKDTIHPKENLKSIVQRYFVEKTPLDEWAAGAPSILEGLARKKMPTPTCQKIQFYSLNKFIRHTCGENLTDTVRADINTLYTTLSTLYLRGITPSFDKLLSLSKIYAPELSKKLGGFQAKIPALSRALVGIYKAAYYPPALQNQAEIEQALAAIRGFTELSALIQEVETQIYARCLQKGNPVNACRALIRRYEHLTTATSVIDLLNKDIRKACNIKRYSFSKPNCFADSISK